MNQGVRKLSFGMRDMNPFPRGHLIKVLDELFSPSPKGKEFDVLLVQLRELSIACKFGIKHQGWFHSTMDAFPEREEHQGRDHQRPLSQRPRTGGVEFACGGEGRRPAD